MLIISASRRTDIPAFFADWFMNRVRQEYFYRVNPYNNKQVTRISLSPPDVAAIVFWTKNPRPLLEHLPELAERGLHHYFQFTLNAYGNPFEPHVPPMEDRIATFRELAAMIGPQRIIWRYDPIILSSATPVEYHSEQLENIAQQLAGSTVRLVFSFMDFYGKVKSRIKELERSRGIIVSDISAACHAAELRQLLGAMSRTAQNYGLGLYSCATAADYSEFGIRHASCIDGELIRELFSSPAVVKRDRQQRADCGCAESVDMGFYNTCRFRCSYCYASGSEKMLACQLQRHNPASPALLYEYTGKSGQL